MSRKRSTRGCQERATSSGLLSLRALPRAHACWLKCFFPDEMAACLMKAVTSSSLNSAIRGFLARPVLAVHPGGHGVRLDISVVGVGPHR
jgi:hypothetical protein